MVFSPNNISGTEAQYQTPLVLINEYLAERFSEEGFGTSRLAELDVAFNDFLFYF